MSPATLNVPVDLETTRRRVGDWAAAQGFAVEERSLPHGVSIGLRSGAGRRSIALYQSAKRPGCRLVFEEPQLEQSADLAAALAPGELEGAHAREGDADTAVAGAARVGADESGKGDYFGPVAACAAFVAPGAERELAALGVRDSKDLSDYEMRRMAPRVREACRYVSVAAIDPERYNTMHDPKRMNANAILAEAHRAAVSGVLDQLESAGTPTGGMAVVLDQFANERLMAKVQREAGWDVRLIQRHRAESDIAVAAASVLARVAFTERLDGLSREAGVTLPKGAGPAVDAAGRELVRRHGTGALDRYAKHHFKNTDRVLQRAFAGRRG